MSSVNVPAHFPSTWVVLMGSLSDGTAILYAGPCEATARSVAEQERKGLLDLMRWAAEELDQDGSFYGDGLRQEIHLQRWCAGSRVAIELVTVHYERGEG